MTVDRRSSHDEVYSGDLEEVMEVAKAVEEEDLYVKVFASYRGGAELRLVYCYVPEDRATLSSTRGSVERTDYRDKYQ